MPSGERTSEPIGVLKMVTVETVTVETVTVETAGAVEVEMIKRRLTLPASTAAMRATP